MRQAIEVCQSCVEGGLVRYIAASTRATLAEESGVDALILRYSMPHKDAAESISFPACIRENKPVLAFTTTRWNALQEGHGDWDGPAPTTGECLAFALASSPPVQVVLHSARDECELNDAMKGLVENVSDVEVDKWKSYRDLD